MGEYMQKFNLSNADDCFKSVLERIVDDADIAVITREDAGDAVVMSMSHYNSLMETLHLLRSPENSAHLSRSISQYRASRSAS